VTKDAPHPNAARLFQDFLMSQESQQIQATNFAYHSARTDVELPAGVPKLKDINLIDINWRDAQAKRKEYTEDWKEIMGR
jgi:iron(III) transport system substrate-binding protein